MNSKEISKKYNHEKNNITKFPIDVRFADSHWELKEKFDNICKIAVEIALEEFKNTRFKHGTFYHVDREKARGLIIMLHPSDSIFVKDYTGESATVLITWKEIDEKLMEE